VTPAIEIIGLTKRFAKTSGYRDILRFWRRQYVTALLDVALEIQEGEVFGLLGPNGAGKTTLLKILTGLVLPTTGRVFVRGLDISKKSGQIKDHLTYVTNEERSLYWRLTGRENLRFFAVVNNVPAKQVNQRVEELLDVVGLADSADTRVMNYSTGMKHRLALARGLLNAPDILLLDEPTRSLDPLGAQGLWSFIKEELVQRQGKTLVIATHNLVEATEICTRLAVIDRGQVRACGTLEELSFAFNGGSRCTIRVKNVARETLTGLERLKGVHAISYLHNNGDGAHNLEVTVEDPSDQIPVIIEHLVRVGGKVLACSPPTHSLTDVLAHLAGEDN